MIEVFSFKSISALTGAKRRLALKKNSKMTRPRKNAAQKTTTTLSPRRTVGIDLGDQTSHYCILDEQGDVVSEGTVRTTEAGFGEQFRRMARARMVLETGTHSPWVSRHLEQLGHEVLVANARQVRIIYDNDRKTDKIDARTLARLARIDKSLLHPIRHRSAEAQADLAVLRARDQLVSVRTTLINCVRGMVKSVGGRLPSASGAYFATKVREEVPACISSALLPLVEEIKNLTGQIREYDQRIEELAKTKYPRTELMRQIPGVGMVTSLAFALTIDDPNRFRKSRDVGSYLGLRPKQSDSGSSKPQLSISKAGDHLVRRLLVNCAHYILGYWGPDCDLRRWGLSLMAHGGKNAKKRAVVAVARKVAVLMHKLWASGEVYEPLRKSMDAALNEAVPAA
jgi:transposase